jgi:hypothetical protein
MFGAFAGLAVWRELAAVGDDEGKGLIGHALLDSKVEKTDADKRSQTQNRQN